MNNYLLNIAIKSNHYLLVLNTFILFGIVNYVYSLGVFFITQHF